MRMFTGLIREIGEVESFNGNLLEIKANYKTNIGDSIAVNGACLTVIEVFKNSFIVELSPESSDVLAMENYKGLVHIEPAMMMGDKFEGHIVQGHIDSIGVIKSINNNGNSIDFIISLPLQYIKYVIPKGSIAIDGVSLTVNDVFTDSFRLTIIPHTIKNTIFKRYKIGTTLNIETDMFARYIYNMFNQTKAISWGDIDKTMALY